MTHATFPGSFGQEQKLSTLIRRWGIRAVLDYLYMVLQERLHGVPTWIVAQPQHLVLLFYCINADVVLSSCRIMLFSDFVCGFYTCSLMRMYLTKERFLVLMQICGVIFSFVVELPCHFDMKETQKRMKHLTLPQSRWLKYSYIINLSRVKIKHGPMAVLDALSVL